MIFTINRLIVYSMKCQKNAKNAHLNFPELNVTSSNCFSASLLCNEAFSCLTHLNLRELRKMTAAPVDDLLVRFHLLPLFSALKRSLLWLCLCHQNGNAPRSSAPGSYRVRETTHWLGLIFVTFKTHLWFPFLCTLRLTLQSDDALSKGQSGLGNTPVEIAPCALAPVHHK